MPSIICFALILNDPLPVDNALCTPPSFLISPPVGKSGPNKLHFLIKSSILSLSANSGLSIIATAASTASIRLWGGIFVAIPTAIPVEPFTNKFGILVGKTVGSFSDPS